MLVIGLTGSIGMGKSAAAAHLRARGVGVFDADAAVHTLYAGAAATGVEAAFPGTVRDGVVDRARLSAWLRDKPQDFARLEAIVHPLVRAEERAFLLAEEKRGATLAVLEIPLLFETGAERLMDAVIVVSTSPDIQRQRVLERSGMTADQLASLLARQMPDAEKRRRADFVVDTSGTLEQTHAQLDAIMTSLAGRRGEAFQKHWASGRADAATT